MEALRKFSKAVSDMPDEFLMPTDFKGLQSSFIEFVIEGNTEDMYAGVRLLSTRFPTLQYMLTFPYGHLKDIRRDRAKKMDILLQTNLMYFEDLILYGDFESFDGLFEQLKDDNLWMSMLRSLRRYCRNDESQVSDARIQWIHEKLGHVFPDRLINQSMVYFASPRFVEMNLPNMVEGQAESLFVLSWSLRLGDDRVNGVLMHHLMTEGLVDDYVVFKFAQYFRPIIYIVDIGIMRKNLSENSLDAVYLRKYCLSLIFFIDRVLRLGLAGIQGEFGTVAPERSLRSALQNLQSLFASDETMETQ